MGKVYFLLLFFAVFGIFSGERGVNNRLRVRGADEGDYKDVRKNDFIRDQRAVFL